MPRVKKKESILLKFLYHRITITLIGLIILTFISIPLAKNVSKQYRINHEINELESEIARLQSKNTELKKLMDYLESDQFIEEQARLNLSYKKPDESVVVVKPNENEANSALKTGDGGIAGNKNLALAGKNTGNASNWWHYFFK